TRSQCEAPTLWTSADRAGVEQAFAHSDRRHAKATRDRVMPKLEAFAKAWHTEYAGACAAYHERHVVSADRFDRAVACLERANQVFAASVARLRRADVDAIDNAIALADALPALADCRDDATLARIAPLPADPAKRSAIARVEDKLSRAEVA